MSTRVLPTAYWPPVSWIQVAKQNPFLIEAKEHFPKQTIRNRAYVADDHRIQKLIVPLAGRKDKTLTCEIRTDDRQPWQRTHLRTLQACYRRSPWFEFYEEELITLYATKTSYLLDFNNLILERLSEWLKIPFSYELTSTYSDPVNIPSADLQVAEGSGRSVKLHAQTSILDLLFWEGKHTAAVLEKLRVQ